MPRTDFQKYATNPYEDTVTNGKTYYYTAFAYSDHGVFNRSCECQGTAKPNTNAKVTVTFTASEAGLHKLTAKKGAKSVQATVSLAGVAYLELNETGTWLVGGREVQISQMGQEVSLSEDIYGYDLVIKEADTEHSVSYPASVTNAGWTPVPECGADAEINVGEQWMRFVNEFLKAEPVMLGFNGQVVERLDPSDQTKVRDTGEPSKISDTSCNANAMLALPKKYLRRWTSDGTAHFRICGMQLDGYMPYNWMYGTTDANAKEIDCIYIRMFDPRIIDGKIRSLAGGVPSSQVATSQLGNYLSAMGDGWILNDWANLNLIRDIAFLMGRSTDSQKHFGHGYVSGGANGGSLHATGSRKSYGPFFGGTGNSDVKFLWMENLWGNMGELGYGAVCKNNNTWIKMYPPYTITLNDVTAENGWHDTGHGAAGSGCISNYSYDSYGLVPIECNGTDSTYIPDGGGTSNNCQLMISLHCASNNANGLACCSIGWGIANASGSWCWSGSLAYKRQPTE